MKSRRPLRRTPRLPRRPRPLTLELREDRMAPAATPLNVFAQFAGDVPAGGTRSIIVTLRSPADFTLAGGTTLLGVVARAAGSGLDPAVVQVTQNGTPVVPLTSSANLPGRTDSVTLVELSAASYTLTVSGENGTGGAYAIDVYLVGDADGSHTVDNADGLALRALYGKTAGDPAFKVEADANRDDRIDSSDVALWRKNLNDATRIHVLQATVGLAPDPVRLGDGRLLTNVAASAVTGTVNAPGATVALETGVDDNFDEGTVTADGAGNFRIPTTLAEGAATLRLRLGDGFGQQTVVSQAATLDTMPPTLGGAGLGTLGAPSAPVTTVDVPYSEVMADGAFVVAGYSVTVSAGPHAGDAVAVASVERVGDSLARLHFASALDEGQSYRVDVSSAVTDLARNPLGGSRTLAFTVAESFQVAEVAPANGEEMVSLTRAAVVRFTKAVDPTTITAAAIQVIALGQTVPGRLVVSSTNQFVTFFPDNPWPSSTEVRVRVDGSKIKAANGHALDADGDGFGGGLATADFRTLPLTRIAGTNLFGYVYDAYNKNPDGSNIPVVGATIRVDALPAANAVTDANGYFLLRDMPSPGFSVHIDGTTAVNAPAGTTYPSVGKEFHDVPGQTVQLTTPDGRLFNVYLPPMATGDIKPLSSTQPTDVGFGAGGMSELHAMFPDVAASVWQKLKVTFSPNSAQDNQGTPSTEAAIIPVPPDRLPAPLPPGQNPKLVISIQAIGATRFDVPAPLTYPNIDNLAPGTQALIWSFNHDAGRWDVVGTGTVSADGSVITSDPGVGIRAPGWHFVIQGSPARFQVGSSMRGELGAGDDFVMSDGLFKQVDDGINQMLNQTLRDLIQRIPGVGDVDLNINFSFLERSLEACGVTFSTIGAVRYLADPFTVEPYFLRFLRGEGGRITGTDLLDRVRNDVDVKRITADLKKIVQDRITEEINTQATTGVVDLDVVMQKVLNSIPPEQLPMVTFHSDGTLFLVIDRTQEATAELDALRATGKIINPSVGGTGTWSGRFIYTLSDDFGFDAHDVTGQFDQGEADEANARAALARAGVAAAQASASVGSKDYASAAAHFRDAAAATFEAAADVGKAFLHYAAGTGIGCLRALQLHGAAKPYIIDLPIDDSVSGSFVIPPGFKDILIRGSGGRGPLGRSSYGRAPSENNHVSQVSGFGTSGDVYFRYVLGNGLQLSGIAKNGELVNNVVLPPGESFTATFYAPRINSSLVISGHASPSGAPTFLQQKLSGIPGEVGTLEMNSFGGIDSDGDGIPDVGEFAIGTDPHKVSTAGDGVSDGAKLAAGLNPLEGRAFPTGVIATLPLPGPAEKVTVEGSRVYAAMGGAGLAVVDGTQFNNPILLGQLALPGTATSVGVDGNLNLAAVATGSALQIVDVADGMAPKLLRSVAVPAAQVVVANGLAYAASGNGLKVVDLVTGVVIQSVTLPTSTVTGLARDGKFLYAYGGGTFVVVDISTEGAAVVRGQLGVSIASSDVGVFAANGVAWLSGSGLRTIDVSNPASPTLMHAPGGNDFVNARRFALNGSGLGALVPDGNTYFELYDTSNPRVTPPRLLQIPLSAGTRDVALSRGIAYIGERNRLEVVNYLPFDNKGIPPTVSVSTSAADVDLVKPGLQVFEGSTLPIQVNVGDDVQVRDVQLLVNGQPLRDAVSFPFDFFAVAPSIANSGSSFTIQVRATDTGGNTSLSNVLTVGLVNDTSPPTVTSFDPANGSSLTEQPLTVRVRFNKSLDTTTVTTANFQLRDGNGNAVTPTNLQVRDDDRQVQITYPFLPAGGYQLVINGPAVTDRVGHALSIGNVTDSFTLTPRAALTTTAVDADPNAPGLQVFENTTIHGTVSVVAGVAVRSVDLLFNGQVVSNGTAAPFNFSVIAPSVSATVSSFTLQARLTDTDGFSTVSNLLPIGLLKDVAPPTVASVTPPNGAVPSQGPEDVDVAFSESIAPASAAAGNFQILDAGPGGVFGDGNDSPVALTRVALLSDDTVVRLTAPLPAGVYQLRINQAGVTDRAGNAMGTGTFQRTFRVVIQSFFDLSAFTRNGAAGPINATPVVFNGQRVLRLTNDFQQAGSAFLTAPTPLTVGGAEASFGTAFQFQISNSRGIGDSDGQGGDGMAFVIARSSTALGGAGGGIGYLGIGPSLAVEFDTYNNGAVDRNSGNHVAVHLNGSDQPSALVPVSPRLNNGAVWYAWVDYDGQAHRLEVRLAQTATRPASPTISLPVALRSVLGQDNAFFGFTSGTFSAVNDHDVRFWRLTTTPAVANGPALRNLAGPAPVGQDVGAALTNTTLRGFAAYAVARWEDVLGRSAFPTFTVQVEDLPPGQLGEARRVLSTGSSPEERWVIAVDEDADRFGWFVDPTPLRDEEFAKELTSTARVAGEGTAASGRYDLMTVLLHEMGHILGFTTSAPGFAGHVTTTGGVTRFVGADFTAALTPDGDHLDATAQPWDLMNDALLPGVRERPSALDLAILRASGVGSPVLTDVSARATERSRGIGEALARLTLPGLSLLLAPAAGAAPVSAAKMPSALPAAALRPRDDTAVADTRRGGTSAAALLGAAKRPEDAASRDALFGLPDWRGGEN